MTGAQHFAEAERITVGIADVAQLAKEGSRTPALVGVVFQGAALNAAVAQVHATLALAAAVERQTRLIHGDDTSGYGSELAGRVAVR